MRPEEFVSFLHTHKASAILRTSVGQAAKPAMDAAMRGGFKVIEFTLTTPGALELIGEFSKRQGIVVGAGTVLTADDAKAAVDAGAAFLVSPVVDEAVIEAARSLGVAMMPGTHTPTEMLRAHRAGASLQKLFPAPGIGPATSERIIAKLRRKVPKFALLVARDAPRAADVERDVVSEAFEVLRALGHGESDAHRLPDEAMSKEKKFKVELD